MPCVATETTIRARPEAIGARLSDAPGFAHWNSTVDNVEGRSALRLEFSGLLAPLIAKSIPDRQPSFERIAPDLKQEAEQAEASTSEEGRNG